MCSWRRAPPRPRRAFLPSALLSVPRRSRPSRPPQPSRVFLTPRPAAAGSRKGSKTESDLSVKKKKKPARPDRQPHLHQPAARTSAALPGKREQQKKRPCTAQPSEPFLFPKLRNYFVDFPHLHYFKDQSFFNLKTCCGYWYDMQRYAALRRPAFQGPKVQ